MSRTIDFENILTATGQKVTVCSNSRAQARWPEFKMVLVGVSEYARKAGDRTYVVPVRLLGG